MLVNKIGDLSLLIGMSILFFSFGTLKYTSIFSLIIYYLDTKIFFLGLTFNIINLLCLFLFIGAMGKSAQLGLHM